MNPLRKHFDPESPFPVEYVYRHTKGRQAELPDHLHDWYEVVYIHEGRGTFFINHSFYGMSRGDLFLIPGNTIHRSFSENDAPITSTAAFFSGGFVQAASFGDTFSFLRCFEIAKKRHSYKLELGPEEQLRLEALLAAMQTELTDEQPGFRQAVLLHLQTLLLQTNRRLAPAPEAHRPAAVVGPLWMKEALHHIDGSLEEPLSLSALAVRASVNPAHFSRVFKQLTGMNVTEYVTAKRIIHAKELLLETDANIREIADRCGFESLPHFHRMFKKIAGVTPAHYKRNHRAY